MIGVTLFGIFLTPVFFFGLSWLGGRQPRGEGPPDGSSKQPAAKTVEGDGSGRHQSAQTTPGSSAG